MIQNYKIVTLCGSTRFKDQFLETQKRLTLEGCIVISVGLFGHSGDEEVWKPGTKEMLDDMHLRKIDLADEIFVINVGGYIGESTRREIAYAEKTGKKVRYLEEDLEVLGQEVEIIKELSDKPFTLAAIMIKDWNQELTPWSVPPVFGKIPFGSGAEDTLKFITSQLLPIVQEGTAHVILGGYSLAGLFALWASYQTDKFEGIVAASPSVWFPKWIEYAKDNKPLSKSIYLSLGDKEEKTKNPVMAQVGNAIRRQNELLKGQNVNTILEWNPGNHFIDSEKRTAKGFAWVMNI